MSTLLFLLGFAQCVVQGSASWGATYPGSLLSVRGSCAVIPCTFRFPSNVDSSAGITAIWYKEHAGQQITVYHSATPASADERFRARTELLGNPLQKNCSLLLRAVTTSDSGKYNFRFEVRNANSWTEKRTVQLTVTDKLEPPAVASLGDLQEGVPATFNCSSPYVCPFATSSLQWTGYNAEASLVSEQVQLSTAGVLWRETLHTSFSWKEHNQKLSCELSVGTEKAVGDITVRVKHAPQGVAVSLNPPAQNIRVGDAASLVCNVNSSYPDVASYRWFKDGAASGNERVKSFPSVAREDYGQYRCEATNSVGTGRAEEVTFFVFSPVLSVSPSSSVREGEAVTLACDVPGEDKQELQYSWSKNGAWLQDGATRSLAFHEVGVADAGSYMCQVQNDRGSETSRAVELNIVYPPRSPSLTLFQETREGQLAFLACTVDSNPQATLSLYQDGRLVARSSSHSVLSQRRSITSTRNALKLEIKKVVPEDAGEYECVATNSYGNSSSTQLFSVQTARVHVSPSSEVPEGERVALTCLAASGPGEESTYTWYKNAKWLRAGPESALVFPAVASTDAGTFHCEARSRNGSSASPAVPLRVLLASSEKSVEVEKMEQQSKALWAVAPGVLCPEAPSVPWAPTRLAFCPIDSPRLPIMSSLLQTRGGRLGILQCTVDSDPPSELALYKGDTLIGSTSSSPADGDPRLRVTSAHNTLKLSITDVTLEDEGPYVCSAENRYGKSTASLDFAAETAEVVATPSPEVREGAPLRLSCAVNSSASGPANYTWYKDGLILREASGESLEFQRVTREDAGVYRCQVEKQRIRKASRSLAVSVLHPPGTPRVAVFVETERGRVAVFQCSVDSNPPAKLALYKGGKVIASSGSEPNAAPQRVRVGAARNDLQVELRELVPEDEGSYNITATNAYGSSSRLVYFHVQTARVQVTPSPELLEGDSASLACNMRALSPEGSVFSWYRNGRRLAGHNASVLAFPSITSGDAGSYHCQARSLEEGGASISLPVSITVYYPPRKPQVAAFLQTQTGRVAIIQCTVDSEPPAQLAISHGKELLASSVRAGPSRAGQGRVRVSAAVNSLKVELRDVVMQDEGDYTCSAANAYGNQSASMTFTAGRDLVNLTCVVDSASEDEKRYTWYKNGRWYAEGSSRVLALSQATAADTGSYSCTVKTPDAVRNSSVGTLSVLYAPRRVQVKSFLETQGGRLASIVCTVDSNPPSALLLRRAGQVLAASAFQAARGSDRGVRVASAPNSLRLEIPDAGREDEGAYECLASNAVGEATASLDLRVETTRVVIRPQPEVREGRPASLTCEDTSTSAIAKYTWYRNSRWLSEGSASALLFQAVAASDGGVYSCRAHHTEGSRASPPVTLHVLYAPKQPLLASFLETRSSNRAVLQCTVESHPPSDLALFRGSVLVASSRGSGNWPPQRLSIHAAHNSLKVEIKELVLEDEGQYRCLANNTYGNSAASMRFSVEGARVTVDPSPDIQEGATANLTCVVASRGAQEMNYTWYKNSRWFRESPGRSLVLGGVTRADTGTYHCRAAGGTRSVTSASASVNVLYAPQSLCISAFLDNEKGKVGIIFCAVDSHPRATLTLHKGGRLVAESNSSRSVAGQRFIPLPSYNSLRLEIRDLQAEDSGLYVCRAANRFGHAVSTIDFSAGTLSNLRLFRILAGVFGFLVCIAVVCGLAFCMASSGTR
ncbi:Sialoadhesin [Varanus komodoensis]|nr:Sialoadhesin [Varanus komodoensis]